MYNTLITLLDDHNESIMIIAEKYNIKKVYIFQRQCDNLKIKDKLEEYLNNKGNIYVEFIRIEDLEKQIQEILYREKDIIINLTGGKRIDSLRFLKIATLLDIESIYVDIIDGKEYFLRNNKDNNNESEINISIEDILDVGGNDIVFDSSMIANYDDIKYFANVILENMTLWHKYKQKLYDNSIFFHDYKDTKRVVIYKDKLNEYEKELVCNILKKLRDMKEITYIDGESIEVTFLNKYLKGFIFKSGTWLEVITDNIVSSIESVDDVKSGLVFLWNKQACEVKNELDVIAVRDANMICISCKDSEKYDENALNELKVYSEKIGGSGSKKILVATKPPIKKTVVERAKQMGIHLVILSSDLGKFKKEIRSIIEE